MITKKDLDAAIAECQGKRNPDAKTCIMLAAFLTIKRELFEEEKQDEQYSYAPAPRDEKYFAVMDELMETLKVIMPRLYDAVMDKLA